jgi:hypothetical protein
MICQWCEEPIEEAETVRPCVSVIEMHRECAYRAACGSLAHLMRRCSCYVPGSCEGDPKGMTTREAAMAAWEFGILLSTIKAARREANA